MPHDNEKLVRNDIKRKSYQFEEMPNEKNMLTRVQEHSEKKNKTIWYNYK